MTSINEKRRRFLTIATSFVAGAGVVGAAVPFIQSWNPSAKAKSEGAPIKVDISKIEPGSQIVVPWQRKPVWVLRRSQKNLRDLIDANHKQGLRDPDSKVNQQPDYAQNQYRSLREDIFIAVAICTHLGCVPTYMPDDYNEIGSGLYFCACHGSKFDLAGRVFKAVPAPTNLIVPPHHYLSETIVEIGVDENTNT